MAYSVNVIQNTLLQMNINAALGIAVPEGDAALLLAVLDLLEQAHSNEEACEIGDELKIEILAKYELEEYIQGEVEAMLKLVLT